MSPTPTFTCSCCNRRHPLVDLRRFNELEYCPECLSETTVFCADCGLRIAADASYGNDGHPLCESCYERNYVTCDRCGTVIHRNDAHYAYDDEDEECPLCWGCYRKQNKTIHDYCYKPEPIFYGSGPRYFGVELEIDCAGESQDHARNILEIGNADHDHIYCKHDGSLEDGFEIVSHPMSLAYHMDAMPWAEVIEEAREMGYLSHQAGTCGLHIHVSRNAFGYYECEQEATIARILYFFEKHWEELLKFSRRTQSQLDQWASRYGYQNDPKKILDDAKHRNGRGRYTAVNLTNADTIEFRMFRGTLKLNTFLATLQLVDRVCDVALSMSDQQIKDMSWTTFVSGCGRPELIQYLKERRLYVNEPVHIEAEV